MTSPGLSVSRRFSTPSFHVFFSRLVFTPLCLLAALAGTAWAQLVSIKTVPIAQGDQFEIFPSHNLAMGGVSIALPDTLLDPFRNPAKGARLAAAPRFFGSPTFYGISNGAGGGRTLPIAGVTQAGSWYGGLSLALQEVDGSRPPASVGFPPPGVATTRDAVIQDFPDPAPDQRSHGNAYAFVMLGKVAEPRLSVAGSISWARLTAVDGVDLLFPGSRAIDQLGHAIDVRVGMLKEWAGDRSFEAVALHNRFGMTDDVTYLDSFWDPATQQVVQRPRLEHELERTNTWGLHLQYERPLGASGWRVGWLATGNLMTHPKIPNYEIMSIPRDPGHSHAYNLGVGFSRTNGPATFGLDAIYEPIWSRTWAEAETPTETAFGATIPAGGRTVENRFRFSNALVRMGVSRELPFGGRPRAAAVQLGLAARSIHYRLTQYDRVQVSRRNQVESWVEWTPTWGFSLRFPELELRYSGRVTKGTGRPGVGGVQPNPWALADAGAVRAGSLLVAPSGPLTLDAVSVVSHQISLSLPIR